MKTNVHTLSNSRSYLIRCPGKNHVNSEKLKSEKFEFLKLKNLTALMIRNNIRQVTNIRSLHRTAPAHSFLGDWFSSKKQNKQEEPLSAQVKKEKKDLVKDQDNFEIDPNSKIVFLNEKNSTDNKPFSIETHMPDFKIVQWKSKSLSLKQAHETYKPEDLVTIINETLTKMGKTPASEETFSGISLEDLNFRFNFAKELQKKLGVDINDYTLSKSHNLGYLFNELSTMIFSKYKNERNPNDINLKQSDFTAPNVYVSEELSEFEKDRELKKLVEEARRSL